MNKSIFLILICLIFPNFALIPPPILLDDPEFEWMVKVGDSMTYSYKKFFEIHDSDGNGDQYSTNFPIVNVDGDQVNISLKAGLKVKAEIKELGEFPQIQLSFNGILTPINDYLSIFYSIIVMQTVSNQTYWENQSFQRTEVDAFSNATFAAYLEGKYFVSSFDYLANNQPGAGASGLHIRNWKTGWLAYFYQRSWNATHTTSELEISTESQGIFANMNLERNIIPIMFLLTLSIIVIIRKRIRSHQ